MRANVTQTQRLLPCQSNPAKNETRQSLCQKNTHTSRISCSSIHPATSVLFAKISRLAPDSRFRIGRQRCGFFFPPGGITLSAQNAPLQAVDHAVRLCNPLSSDGLSRRRPISGRPFSQSSCASTTSEFFGHRRPLPFMSVLVLCTGGGSQDSHSQMFSLYLASLCQQPVLGYRREITKAPLPLTRRVLLS